MENEEYMTCNCRGGDLPPEPIWELHRRRGEAGNCDGSVTTDGRCRAFADDDLWVNKDED